jgi:hypothetical protein
MRRSRPSLALMVAALAGCGGGSGSLQLSWTFADGRRCPDTGAATVEVRIDDAAKASSFACSAGLAPASVPLAGVPTGGATLHLDALSPQGSALYHGDLPLDALPVAATAELYAKAAR